MCTASHFATLAVQLQGEIPTNGIVVSKGIDAVVLTSDAKLPPRGVHSQWQLRNTLGSLHPNNTARSHSLDLCQRDGRTWYFGVAFACVFQVISEIELLFIHLSTIDILLSVNCLYLLSVFLDLKCSI